MGNSTHVGSRTPRARSVALACTLALAVIGTTACGGGPLSPTGSGSSGGSSSGGGSGGGGTSASSGTVRVSYTGFVGASLRASVPTLCPNAACNIPPPVQNAVVPGSFSYPVVAGNVYTIHGTIVGRSAPLGAPATGVSGELFFDVQPSAANPLTSQFGLPFDSIFVNGTLFDPRGQRGAGRCGVWFFSSTPDAVATWVYTFKVEQYPTSAQPGSTFCA